MEFRKIFIRIIAFGYLATISCEDFVDIDTPNFQMISKDVFADDKTANAAIRGIYNQLINANFSNGSQNSVTVLSGMSGDIIEPRSTTHPTYAPFWKHQISVIDTPDALANLDLWSSAYNIIYLTNSALEGLDNSYGITETTRNKLRGQALFIRAFTYFYLTMLYGDVPLILNTDYRQNTMAERKPASQIWEQLSFDLDRSIALLEDVKDYPSGERINVNLFVVMSFRARIYLFEKSWAKAEEMSNQVISQISTYEILDDLEEVFLANSREAIWQISPAGNEGGQTTFEANVFIRYPIIPGVVVVGDVKLSDNFIQDMDTEDKRLNHWIGRELDKNGETANYYSYKYKAFFASGQDIPEYSMVLRLAEQYLIRAEAKVMQNKFLEAIKDIDRLRSRAGIDLLSDTNLDLSKDNLLQIIMQERKKELFAEWGHRWLDLKRTDKASEVFSTMDSAWQNTDIWYPIPEEERLKNTNLTQNEGY